MFLYNIKSTYLLLILGFISCAKQVKKPSVKTETPIKEVKVLQTGAERTNLYVSKLIGKNVAVVANQTSVIINNNNKDKPTYTHLIDSLLTLDITIKQVFAPEHGFRGKADAGELVKDGIDSKTGLPIISLYGNNKKPSLKQLKGTDVVIFDIQDVGARFYTYISTLHYVMEACAEANIPVIILDRPNPNGHYIDGPVLDKVHKSFVGMHKVPVVYGMTIGEYGQMINGEKWLENGIQCNLTVIPLDNYTHATRYSLPVNPSPNLPNDKSINLYPSLCFFEGTQVSVGRGTNNQFQIYGSPYLEKTDFLFTPKPNEGAKYPKHENKVCYGENLKQTPHLSQLNLTWLIKAHQQTSMVKTKFWRTDFFTKLAGTKKLKEQIIKGITEKEIRISWAKDIAEFKKVRELYVLYK